MYYGQNDDNNDDDKYDDDDDDEDDDDNAITMMLKLMKIFMMMMLMKIIISNVMTVAMIKGCQKVILNFSHQAVNKPPNQCVFTLILDSFCYMVWSTVVRDIKAVKCQIKNFTT